MAASEQQIEWMHALEGGKTIEIPSGEHLWVIPPALSVALSGAEGQVVPAPGAVDPAIRVRPSWRGAVVTGESIDEDSFPGVKIIIEQVKVREAN